MVLLDGKGDWCVRSTSTTFRQNVIFKFKDTSKTFSKPCAGFHKKYVCWLLKQSKKKDKKKRNKKEPSSTTATSSVTTNGERNILSLSGGSTGIPGRPGQQMASFGME
jgi:hypothetical protein